MNNRKLGIIFIIVAIFFSIILIVFVNQINILVDQLMVSSGGTCITNGQCIHEQNNIPIYFGIAIIIATLSFGIYLMFFERSQRHVEKTHEKLISRLEETKKETDSDERFSILLGALNENEKNIMKAVREQEGITQSTLRIRTSMSKTKLSFVLKDLEGKNLIKKVAEGKKNLIYLKKQL
jgi:uncharacterized membrane protein